MLEDELDKLQEDGPAAWAELPEDELFTPAGFRAETGRGHRLLQLQLLGSTFRAFFKNKVAVALLIALVAVVAFAFLQPHLPGQVDPNLRKWTPSTGIQYRNIAPGEQGFIWGSNAIGQDLWARIWAGTRTSLFIAFFRGPRGGRGGHHSWACCGAMSASWTSFSPSCTTLWTIFRRPSCSF